MKKLLILLVIAGTSIISACSNDDDNSNPVDQLPPATQSGKQTFACLINGEAFIPDRFGSERPNAFYQFVNNSYTLGISAGKNSSLLESVLIAGIDVKPLKVNTYNLLEEESGKFHGKYLLGGGIELRAVTSSNNQGNLKIAKFDEQSGIVAGTFEFTVLDEEGNEIKVTDGRFDLLYTN